MHFDYTEEHNMLRDAARGHLSRANAVGAYRKGLTRDPAYRRGSLVADADQGWTAMLAADDGATLVEAMVVAEELGYGAHPGAFITAAVTGWALSRAAFGDLEDRLAGLTVGRTLIAAPASASALVASPARDGWVVQGRLSLVQDADIAEALLATVETPTGPLQLLVSMNAPGVAMRPASVIDITRAWFEVSLTDVQVARDALLSDDPTAIRRQADMVSVLAAADSVGAAARLLDMTVAYAKERVAFGKPIAAFQAVKHRCADMLIKLESARVAVWYAALALRDGREDAAEAAAIAKFFATEAASWISGEALQLHGGIGMTWEHDLHLFLKRAKANELLFGANHRHREAVAAALGL